MYALNQIFEKTYPPEAAVWCNTNGYMLTELPKANGVRRFQIVKQPEVPQSEKESFVRMIRDEYLVATDKYMIADFPISASEKNSYLRYRQYLRDYTKQPNWFEHNPKTFEEFVSN